MYMKEFVGNTLKHMKNMETWLVSADQMEINKEVKMIFVCNFPTIR